MSGCPMAVPNWKVPMIVETSGAVIVGEESCVGERGTQWLTEVKGDTVTELLEDITERYFKIDCAVFTPNPSRVDHVKDMFGRYHVQGVIHYSLQFCHPYIVESGPVEAALEKDSIPTLRLETDYSQEDAGQLKTRIEAFRERIQRR
jgi:benzoyl-CoA reductase/2-hydroxyglutaryl-CoA dehydratase subunit BcrC/BadD/HgdB